jgi:hypothetical protein
LEPDLLDEQRRPSGAEPARRVELDQPAGRAASVPQAENRQKAEDRAPEATGVDRVDATGEPAASVFAHEAGPLVDTVPTDFGGLFYLINVGLFLGLYGDFTTPAEPGIALDLWDFVALLGFRLVGEPLRSDPVWPLLARLAGREEQDPPGRKFAPPDDWRLPPEWLSAFPDPDEWLVQSSGERLLVQHSSEFLVLDLPVRAGVVEEQLREELRAYPAALVRQGSVRGVATGDPPLELWLNRLEPYIRARLSRALGVDGAAELGQTLCTARARIFVTGDRLDVMLSLEQHPIAIRLAGLDRDPGWVPAAARFIAFHFE